MRTAHEHGSIIEGPRGPHMTDQGVQLLPSYYTAESKHTQEVATFATYSGASWWLTLIAERTLSEARRREYRESVA